MSFCDLKAEPRKQFLSLAWNPEISIEFLLTLNDRIARPLLFPFSSLLQMAVSNFEIKDATRLNSKGENSRHSGTSKSAATKTKVFFSAPPPPGKITFVGIWKIRGALTSHIGKPDCCVDVFNV